MSTNVRGIRASIVFLTLLPTLRGADLWLETRMAGQPAGYFHESTKALTTVSEMRMVINRAGSRVEIKGDTRSEQSADGKLLGFRSDISSSMQSTRMEGRVRDGAMALKISTGGKTYDRSIPLAGELLGPEGARRLTLARLKAAGDSVSYQVFTPELGSVSTVTRTFLAREETGLKIAEEASGLPGKATVWLDGEGRILRQVQPGPLGEIELVRTTKERALAATAATLPAESYKQSLVRSNIRLPDARQIERLRIRIIHKKPELGWPDFASENQTVVEKSADSVVLKIRRPQLAGPGKRPAMMDERLKPYLTPNALFQSDDGEVQRIAREVAGANPDAFASALALRNWTTANMKFDLGIAIVSASEVVRNRAGTCFAYAILLGSLARAAGIPSRMRMGFAYADGIWGGHAWIEVLVEGRWIPIDAALPSPDVADAARFGVFTSSLEEGTIAGMGGLAQLLGNVDIQVLSYTRKGKDQL
jgi:hypothetical protein